MSTHSSSSAICSCQIISALLSSAVTIFYRKIEIEFFPKIEARIKWRSCLIKPSILVHGAGKDRRDQRRPSSKTGHTLTATIGNRKSHVAYRMAPVLVTLKVIPVLQAFSSAIRRTFVQYFTRFPLTARSRGPSATAGLLVFIAEVALLWEKDYCDAVRQPTVQSSGGETRLSSSVR